MMFYPQSRHDMDAAIWIDFEPIQQSNGISTVVLLIAAFVILIFRESHGAYSL
jgi:hypothetical protein